jgi:hypothetical protein
MPDLLIKMSKRRDGTVVARFERADGTATWKRQPARHAEFFVAHDLAHYAVETILGHRRGFYGLVAEGWDLSDFGSPWPRGKLPADAEPAEVIVGFLDAERANLERWSAGDFNSRAALYYEQHELANPPVLDDAALDRIREYARRLRAQWAALPEDGTLELEFTRL